MTEKEHKVFNIILALVVATAAWFFVVLNYDPMTSAQYSGIPVKYTGLNTLANRGYAVAESNHEMVDVTLQQRRVDTANISKDDITVTADVSRLATGDNTVALTVEGPENTQVTDVSVKTVTIDIESAASEEMDISVEYSDSAEENAEPIIEDMSVETATVIATEERLEKIDRVAAVVDPEDLGEKLKPMTEELVALDKDGEKILNVVIYPETVSFKAAAGYIKTVSLEVPVKDGSDDSYDRTYTVPETVVIKGAGKTIDPLTSIKANEVDISYYYEDAEIPIECELPEGIYFAKEQKDLVLTLRVTEKEEEESQ